MGVREGRREDEEMGMGNREKKKKYAAVVVDVRR